MLKPEANQIQKNRKRLNAVYAFSPLLNFSSRQLQLVLPDGLIVSRPSKEERQIIEETVSHYSFGYWKNKWSLVVRSYLYKNGQRNFENINNAFGKLILFSRALRLFKSDSVALGPQYGVTITPLQCVTEGGFKSSNRILSAIHKYKLTKRELVDFIIFYERLCNLDFSKNPRLAIAILRFDFSYDSALLYKPIDLMIGLESLYLAEAQELAYKLAIRAAYLLGDTPERRTQIYRILKKAYTLRSKLVHGEDLPEEVKIATMRPMTLSGFVLLVEDILRNSIKKFIDLLASYSHQQLLETVLDDKVLAGETK